MSLTLSFFDSSHFMPHGHCFLWEPVLLWTFVLSEITIALSYFSIPFTLTYFVYKRKDLGFIRIFMLFSLFIVTCGMTHFLDVWVIWHPDYWVQAVLYVVVAIVSLITAIELAKAVPVALTIPAPSVLEEVIQRLQKTVDELKQTQRQLVESEKQSALGSLVAGVAHELNTPLGNALTAATSVLSANADFLRFSAQGIRRSDLEHLLTVHQDGLQLTLRNLERAVGLIGSFKELSIKDTGTIKPFLLGDLINDVLLIMENRCLKKGLKVYCEVVDHLIMDSYPALIMQVFINLFERSLGEDFQSTLEPAIYIKAKLDGESVQVLFWDNSSMVVSTDQAQHIFEPFYVLGQGSRGLGLHISYNLVNGPLKGSITLDEGANDGIVFLIQLPQHVMSTDSFVVSA